MSNSRLESLKRFLEQEPNDSFTKYAIALEYAGMKEYQMAIAALEDLME